MSVATALPLKTGIWTADAIHSAIVFSIRHLGLAKVRGRFSRFSADLELTDSGLIIVSGTIDMSSIDTNNADRDAHLRGTDFFTVDQHPEMRFSSTAIAGSGESWTMSGEATLNGITKPLTLQVEFNGTQIGTDGKTTVAGFSATGALKRSQFGIEFGMLPIGGDKLALGDEVKFELDLEFIEPQTV